VAELYVVSECCPAGCGVEVVLLRGRPTGGLIAYCELCGCAWSDPGDAQLERGLNAVLPAWALAPEGVELPRAGDVRTAGFAASVLRTLPVSDEWTERLDDLNAEIRRNVAT